MSITMQIIYAEYNVCDFPDYLFVFPKNEPIRSNQNLHRKIQMSNWTHIILPQHIKMARNLLFSKIVKLNITKSFLQCMRVFTTSWYTCES
jgi:hypothetical protein